MRDGKGGATAEICRSPTGFGQQSGQLPDGAGGWPPDSEVGAARCPYPELAFRSRPTGFAAASAPPVVNHPADQVHENLCRQDGR